MKKILFSFLLVLASFAVVVSQTTTGRLSGTVSTADGVVPGATVTATDNKTGKEQTTTTNESGEYIFPQLEFGTYTVKISAAGFKTFVANEVKVDVGREYTLDRQLEVGNVQETVTVTAGADVVTANTAQVSNTISPQQILSLPLITRNPLSLTTLQSGVASNSAQATTINGMRTTFTNITRDGINIQDTFIRTNATDFAPGRPSVDDTGEFTIATTNQEADQGYGGAQIRLVTPRGTKDFHGALFAYNRNSEFAANSFFRNRAGLQRPFRNRNQFGGKLSGPLWVPGFNSGGPMLYKDKGFFFFAYEGIRDPLGDNFTRTILTPSARNGTLTFPRAFAGDPFTNSNGLSCPSGSAGSLCTVTNILTFARSFGGAFATIPATTDPLILARVLSQLPTNSNTSGGDGLNTAGYTLNRLQTQNRDQYSTRVDVDFNERHSWLGIFNYNKESNLRPDADTTKFTSTPGVIQFSTNKQFTMAYRSVITSNFVNEIRGGFFSSEVPFNRTDPLPDYFLAVPLVTFPENTFLSQGRNTKNYTLSDNADYVWNKHTLRFGGQLQVFRVNAFNDVGTVPTVTIGTGAATPTFGAANFPNVCTPSCPAGQTSVINTTQLGTANGLLGLFGGIFNSVGQSFNVADPGAGFQRGVTAFTPWRYENHSVYVFDRWAVNNQLVLSLGMRYEIYPALRLNNGLAIEPAIPDGADPVSVLLNPVGTYQYLGGNAGRKNAYYKTDMDNFAPNLGVAWNPSFDEGVLGFLFGQNKTVIRGGYSWIYGNDSIVTSINNAAVGNAGLGRTTLTFINLNGRLSTSPIPTVPLPANPSFPRSYLFNNAPGIGTFFGTVFGIDPEIQTPRIEQYNFGVQREFFGNTAVEIRYVGTRSNNLARGIDLNQVDIFNNGFLADFLRAQANLRLTGNAFCVSAGCQALTIFQNGGAPAAGRLVVGTGGLSATTFNNALNNGTPADLAVSFINSAANLNNQPCEGAAGCNPSAVPRINFLRNNSTGVVDYFCNCGSYNYNSLQIEIRRRFTDGLYFQANYTFSKNLTDAIGTSQQLFEPYLDQNNQHLDFQRADFDQTHVFNFNGIYQLPFGKGKRFLNQGGWVDKIFGGFELSGLMQWTTGAPITFVDTRGTFNRTGRSGRQTPTSALTNDEIRALAGVFRAPNGNIYFIDPSIINGNGQAGTGTGQASLGYGTAAFPGQVFFNVEAGQTGNVGRALIDGPSYMNVNMALLKNIRFTETMRLQLRMEAFNVFNKVNFIQNTQFANINSATFGQITSTFDPRQIQFAARFEF
jgi:Carboxypeptidase regulatory-like domain